MKNLQLEEDEGWNKKRLIIFGLIILFGIAGYFYKLVFLDKRNIFQELNSKVMGVSTKNDKKTLKEEFKYTNSFKEGVQEKIDSIKKDVANLKVEEVASSSSQIQKVLNDIKNLENLPRNQAKETCKKICEGI